MRPSGVGSPRYFSSKVTVPMFNVVLTASCLSIAQAEPKRALHLAGLINCPVALAYVFSTSWTFWASSFSALKNSNVSSANRRWDTTGAFVQIFTPEMRPLLWASWRRADSPSAQMTKRYGDIGSPCLTPLLHLFFFPATLLRKTEVEAEFKILVT